MKYIRIVMYYTRMCIMREMLFRTNFIIRIITDLSWLLGTLVFLNIVTSHYETIAGWETDSLYILFGTHCIVNYLFTAFLLINGLNLGMNINSGELDQILLKPLPAGFSVSFKTVDLSGIVQVLIGIGIVWWGCKKTARTITILSFVVYLIQIICGVLIVYGMFFSLMYTAFWFKKTQGLESIHYSTYDFRSFPAEIYPLKIRFVFTLIIPLTLVANPAAKTLIFGTTIIEVTSSIATAFVWIGISSITLLRGLQRYRGSGG